MTSNEEAKDAGDEDDGKKEKKAFTARHIIYNIYGFYASRSRSRIFAAFRRILISSSLISGEARAWLKSLTVSLWSL